MNEDQNIEYKQSWRDEYLKWVCGFANATGGKIYIGVDDNGQVVGVPDTKRLMEDIPYRSTDTTECLFGQVDVVERGTFAGGVYDGDVFRKTPVEACKQKHSGDIL